MKRMDRLHGTRLKDPYMDKEIYKTPTICPKCGLIFYNKRWSNNEKLKERILLEKKETEYKACPACRKIEDNYPLGVVELSSNILEDKEKREYLMNTIKKEADLEYQRNPLARIMKIEDVNKNMMRVYTTTETLSKKIGKAVSRAFKGDLEISFGEENKFVLVTWKRF